MPRDILAVMDSPLGRLYLAADEAGLRAVDFRSDARALPGVGSAVAFPQPPEVHPTGS